MMLIVFIFSCWLFSNEVKGEIVELEKLLAAAGQTSQSTLLLKKRKEMREVDESLELMKKDHKKRMDDCEERRIQFELKQSKIREQVLKFEKFIQENDAKRMRAEAKSKLERKLHDEKVREIIQLLEKIQRLEEDVKELNEELGEFFCSFYDFLIFDFVPFFFGFYVFGCLVITCFCLDHITACFFLAKKSCFKAYLERIVEEGEYGYEEIPEILNRHSTLKQANYDLLIHSQQLEKQVDEFRRKLQTLRTEKQNTLLVGTSVLQRLQGELERMKSTVKVQEDENIEKVNKKKDVSREYTQIIEAIRNLYGRCYSTLRVKSVFSGPKDSANIHDVLSVELDFIATRIVDLIEITDEYKYPSGGGLSSMSMTEKEKDNHKDNLTTNSTVMSEHSK
jgi:ribosomal protein S20